MEKRGSIVGGVIMIGVGVTFLLLQLFPELAVRLNIGAQWPLIVVLVGGAFLLSAFLGTPHLAIPGSIVTGIGLILYYQNGTGNWASWSFAWALIPGFVGIGLMLSGMLAREKGKTAVQDGRRLIFISAIMFIVFGALFSGLGAIGRFWPVLLIVAGGGILLKQRKG